MRRTLLIILGLILGYLFSGDLYAQSIKYSSYQTVSHIKSDGTIQDSNYRTIGHASSFPMKWAAFYFFFSK